MNGADRAAALAVLLGLIAAFVPWYSYMSATARVTVNGFRASLLGDLFFLAIAATALLLLMRHRVIEDVISERLDERQAFSVVAAVAAGTVLLQLVLDAMGGGRSLGFGFLLAVFAAIALGVAAWLKRPREGARMTVRQMLQEDTFD
ncbi:MAG: hypothetical protein JO198_02320 [Candidatus Dormibacteraeota bacterium]|nr:hypothetical protein [Candidatus Dormibacteraeota bacterium]